MPRSERTARPGNPLVAVAYVRVSTDEQRLGPEAQRAAIEAWAQREGVTVAGWYTDAGVSGGSDLADRPALVAALADLRARRAGVLVIAKRDRLARDVAVAATVERAVKACGAKVLSADGTANGDSAADAFMRTMLDGAAAYERALIRARTKAALAAKRAQGKRAGAVPFGFVADAEGRLVANEAEQTIIAIVRELRAAGMPLRAVVGELARRGLVARTGRALQLTQVARIARAA
ncbi:MAG: recombinase family protein [Polyangiaceae bacterium]